MINDDDSLNEFLVEIASSKILAIDTEFRRVNTYYPELCLIQIASENHPGVCVDVCALKDLTTLYKKLFEPDILWILHSAWQDIEALYFHAHKLPTHLFDTQIAASYLDNGQPQISYQQLTEQLCQVKLAKSYTRIDWRQRPLPHGAYDYALDDVRYLIPMYQKLFQKLKETQVIENFWDDCKSFMEKISKTLRNETLPKLPGLSKLPKAAQKEAETLLIWREKTARTENKPRQWVMKNRKLITLAQIKAKTKN